jgi:magnesium transporter
MLTGLERRWGGRRGLAIAFMMGLLGFAFASRYVAPINGLIVGLTIALVVTFGTTNGTLLPIILRRMGMDPALMSNPLIASLSDALGVLTYCGVAILLLRTSSSGL